MILYQFAYDQHNRIVDVSEAVRYESYICIGCGSRLTPRKGAKNTHHFSHFYKQSISNRKFNCSPEHYIHKAAKELFFSSFKEKKPFLLTREIEHVCINKMATSRCSKLTRETIDLQASYQSIEIEKKDGDFIPDILLSSGSGEKLYIEFAYTHRSSKKKIQSGNKIVEIIIKTEDNIREIITLRNLDATKDNINLYGFEKQRFDCKGECLYNAQQKSRKMYQGGPFLEESIESYHRNGNYKFLIKKIVTEPLPPENFEFYRHYIPILKDIRYEIYLNEELLGEGVSREDVVKIADKYVKKHTPRSLFD